MEELILQIKYQLFKVENQFLNFTETELFHKENPQKWSKKEILGHLVDSAQNNIRRIVVGQYKEGENIVYNQNIWVKAADYQHYNSRDLLDLFLLLNKHFCILLENLPKENYKSITNWGRTVPEIVSLEFVAHDYLKHLEHHVNQLFLDNYTKSFAELK